MRLSLYCLKFANCNESSIDTWNICKIPLFGIWVEKKVRFCFVLCKMSEYLSLLKCVSVVIMYFSIVLILFDLLFVLFLIYLRKCRYEENCFVFRCDICLFYLLKELVPRWFSFWLITWSLINKVLKKKMRQSLLIERESRSRMFWLKLCIWSFDETRLLVVQNNWHDDELHCKHCEKS